MRIFVASLYRDFNRERAVVVDTIREMGYQPVNMEDFGAAQSAPIEVCVAAVRSADVLILLLGADYGSVVPGDDRSFTHVEVETAVALGLPLLVYSRLPDLDRRPPGWPAPYHDLVRQILDQTTAGPIDTPGELRDRIARDVTRLDLSRAVGPSVADARDAILAGDLATARRLLFTALADNRAEPYRLLTLVELLGAPGLSGPSDAIAMLSRAAAAGDTRSAAALKALVACAPAWIDAGQG